jgi:uncharacterized membrane protein YeaQ/YmgE (transglycosylase-associated protein family)
MQAFSLFFLVLIAGICGAVGLRLAGNAHAGVGSSLLVGFFGALVGSGLHRALHLPELIPLRIGNDVLPVMWTVVGSFVLVFVISILERRRLV